ncbi:MAG TPA: hypothetical protein DDW18_04330 [Firmicutes bacterium]|nr:hypothetical protein [Bacillota bacterium]
MAFAGFSSLLEIEDATLLDEAVPSEFASSLELPSFTVQDPNKRNDANIIIFPFFIIYPREI